MFWRGASTGGRVWLGVKRWQDVPRFRLCLMAAALDPDKFDIGISNIVQIRDSRERDEIAASNVLKPRVPLIDFMKYQFAIDIDGNTYSWPGMFTKLLMGNTIIKIESPLGFRQWYYDDLIPGCNYVAISPEMRELSEVYETLLQSPERARAIADEGRQLGSRLSFKSAIMSVIPRIAYALQH